MLTISGRANLFLPIVYPQVGRVVDPIISRMLLCATKTFRGMSAEAQKKDPTKRLFPRPQLKFTTSNQPEGAQKLFMRAPVQVVTSESLKKEKESLIIPSDSQPKIPAVIDIPTGSKT